MAVLVYLLMKASASLSLLLISMEYFYISIEHDTHPSAWSPGHDLYPAKVLLK